MMAPAEVVREFMRRINQRNVDALTALLAEDHTFIDSLGNAVEGREQMVAGWRGYYAMCPDYWVIADQMFENGSQVAIFGSAGGIIPPDHRWSVPAAWLAVVENGLVKQWRVYADNKPVYDILAERG